MESSNLTTRTYTAPTCILEVTTPGSLASGENRSSKIPIVDFTLHLQDLNTDSATDINGHPEDLAKGEGASSAKTRSSLKGNPQQLVALHRTVSDYVQNLFFQAPRPQILPVVAEIEEAEVGEFIEFDLDDRDGSIAGTNPVLENFSISETNNPIEVNCLPGLQHAPEQPSTPNDSAKTLSLKNVIALLDRQSGRQEVRGQEGESLVKPSTAKRQRSDSDLENTPQLTASDRADRPHRLTLGDLGSSSSSQVIDLATLELFELAAVLDRAGAEIELDALDDAKHPTGEDGDIVHSPRDTATILSTQLPHLPHLPAQGSYIERVGNFSSDNSRGDRLAFPAPLPWAAATAVAVGVPLLVLGPHSSSLKDLTDRVQLPKVKLPNIKEIQTSITAKLSQPQESSSEAEVAEGGVAPWQPQAVQPPQKIATVPKTSADVNSNWDQSSAGVMRMPSPQQSLDQQANSAPTQPGVNSDGMAATVPQQPLTPDLSTAQPSGSNDGIGIASMPRSLMGKETPESNNPVVTAPRPQTQRTPVTIAKATGAKTNLPAITKQSAKLPTPATNSAQAKASAGVPSYINPIAELPEELTNSEPLTPQLPNRLDDVTAATIGFAMRTIAESNANKPSSGRTDRRLTRDRVKATTPKPKTQTKAKVPPQRQISPSQISVPFAPDLPPLPPINAPVESIPEVSLPSFQPLESNRAIEPTQPNVEKTSVTSKVKKSPAKMANKNERKSSDSPSNPFRIPQRQSLPALVPVQPEMINPPQQGEASISPTDKPPLNADGTISTKPASTVITSPSEFKLGKANIEDTFNKPQLEEAKRYLQEKWKPDPQQSEPLQYAIEVSSENGAIQNIVPQGDAARTYMEKTGLMKPGERIISPTTADKSEQKIRVILQPDGQVDAFEEP